MSVGDRYRDTGSQYLSGSNPEFFLMRFWWALIGEQQEMNEKLKEHLASVKEEQMKFCPVCRRDDFPDDTVMSSRGECPDCDANLQHLMAVENAPLEIVVQLKRIAGAIEKMSNHWLFTMPKAADNNLVGGRAVTEVRLDATQEG